MAPSLSRGVAFAYILGLQSRGIYVGCAADFEARFRDHENGTACRSSGRIDRTGATRKTACRSAGERG